MATSIEKFFLATLLRITLGGVGLVLIIDTFFFSEDQLSVYLDIAIFVAAALSFIIRNRYPFASVLTITMVVLGAMVYQCLMVPLNTTLSLAIILIVGFIHSVMLKGPAMHTMHIITTVTVLAIFVMQARNPQLNFTKGTYELQTIAITYSILYFVLTYTTAVLKGAYDKLNLELKLLNGHLEQTVKDRTDKIIEQNEALIKYSYANAHHLRGPVARLLGLANIARLGADVPAEEIVAKMEEQAKEIDEVVKQINRDLEVDSHLDNIPRATTHQGINGTPKTHVADKATP